MCLTLKTDKLCHSRYKRSKMKCLLPDSECRRYDFNIVNIRDNNRVLLPCKKLHHGYRNLQRQHLAGPKFLSTSKVENVFKQ